MLPKLFLAVRLPDIYPAGKNIVEFNGHYRGDVIVGIWVIGVTRAVGCPD